MPSSPDIAILRRKAFALAGQWVGKGELAYKLLHDLTGLEHLSGKDAAFSELSLTTPPPKNSCFASSRRTGTG